ncbi:hypothetical protein RZS08_40635, partial [Arthrospira platensis SPKY1]|nr:hypothetical protein [Arthrospira platensis SPKY1]
KFQRMDGAMLYQRSRQSALRESPPSEGGRGRNAIFAHHGKEFEDPELNRFFYGKQGLKDCTKTPLSQWERGLGVRVLFSMG